MAYWVYVNWVAEQQAMIHRATCGFCQDGKGCHANPLGERNGKWHGRFTTLQAAEAAAQATERPVYRCRSCLRTLDALEETPMDFPWGEPFCIESLYDRWDTAPSTAGIYVIGCGRPLNRVGRLDPAGIIYVGKSRCLRDRLWTYWYVQHEASGILWENLQLAEALFGKPVRAVTDVVLLIGQSIARVSTPIPPHDLDVAERAVLYAYTLRFGEPPPLNAALPGRWMTAPTAEKLRWAEQGLDPKWLAVVK